jgi:zinc protease
MVSKFRLVLLGATLLAAAPALAQLPIQHWQTKSGARVYFVENHDLPMLDVSVDFPAGAGHDTRDKAGLANLAHHMMKLGAGGLSEDEIAKRLADVGAQLDGRFDKDRAAWALRTLVSERELEHGLDILARILQSPEFPEGPLARERNRLVAALKEAETKPDAIAEKNFYALLYRDHPYGLRASGEIDTLNALNRADLKRFYEEHYVGEEAVVAMIGDITRAQAEAIAERLTQQLPRFDGKARTIPKVNDPAGARVEKIEHPATQSHILLGYPGVTRSDPDYFPLYVGNYVLGGGGFVSRLTEEVRQKRGLAYSVYSYFLPLEQEGPFQIGLQTKKEQAHDALEVVRGTVKGFIARGPSEEELKAAKQNLVLGFPLRIDSNKEIHEYLAMIGFYRMPLTYLDDFPKNVERVTAAQIKDAFSRRIDPERFVTVIVGAEEQKGRKAESNAPQ